MHLEHTAAALDPATTSARIPESPESLASRNHAGGAMTAVTASLSLADDKMSPTPPTESLRQADGTIYPGWPTTFASMIGLTLGPSAMLVFCFGTFVPALEREFGWGIGAISFGGTIITVLIVITSLLAGYLIDRIGARRLVLWSVPCFGLGLASLALLHADIRIFYLGLALVSLAGVGCWPVAYNKATALWFDRRLGFSLGLANTGIGIGAALLPPLVAAVIAQSGWRTAYVMLGVLAVVIPWPMAWAMLKERDGASSGRAAQRALPATSDLSFAESRATREFWLMLVGFFALGMVSSGVVVHQVRILIDAGISAREAAGMQSVLGVALIVGRVSTGWLLDRVKASVIMALVCLAAALSAGLLAAGAPFGTAALCAALMGFVIGAEFDVLGFLIPRYFGRRSFGVLYGTIYAVFQVAAATTIGLLGWWRGSYGSYFVGLCVIAAVLVIAAVVFGCLGRYRFLPIGAPSSEST